MLPYPNDHGLWSENKTACAHMDKIRKWFPMQQTADGQCYEQGKFGAMKTMSGCRALRCGKHQFCTRIMVFKDV